MTGPGNLDRHGVGHMSRERPMVVGRNGGVGGSPRDKYRDAVQQAGLALRADRLASPVDDGAGSADERGALLAVA
jgi:hypothetical protein